MQSLTTQTHEVWEKSKVPVAGRLKFRGVPSKFPQIPDGGACTSEFLWEFSGTRFRARPARVSSLVPSGAWRTGLRDMTAYACGHWRVSARVWRVCRGSLVRDRRGSSEESRKEQCAMEAGWGGWLAAASAFDHQTLPSAMEARVVKGGARARGRARATTGAPAPVMRAATASPSTAIVANERGWQPAGDSFWASPRAF